MTVSSAIEEGTPPGEASAPLDVRAIHAEHGEFVWATLQRLGIRETDREDLFQEVFVVVHRRLATFDGSSRMTTWLFGICLRVAAAHRRRAYVRREVPSDVDAQRESIAARDGETPEDEAVAREERETLQAILDEMDLEKRAVFVMFAIEEMSCEQIAEITGAPKGTVHSRLHAARTQFRAAIARWKARDARRGGR